MKEWQALGIATLFFVLIWCKLKQIQYICIIFDKYVLAE